MKSYDFALSWSIKKEELFTRTLRAACKKRRLSFFWIYDGNLEEVLAELAYGNLKIKVLLDTEATYNKDNDKYARLCFLVKKNGGTVINDPNKARLTTDKSFIHPKLKKLGLNTPYTIIIRGDRAKNFKLTKEQKKNLKIPFVIKPACGYAQKGLTKNATGLKKEIKKAVDFDPDENILFQEKIIPISFGKRVAWFRVFRVFDSVVLCWWDYRNSRYDLVKRREFKKYGLSPLAEIVFKIASLTGMYFFSTEVAVDNKFGKNRFVVVDYVNDQCDMSAQSAEPTSPPDRMVAYVAKEIIAASARLAKKKKIGKRLHIWF